MSNERIRGVLKLPGLVAEPVEFELDSEAIKRVLGEDARPIFGQIGPDETELLFYGAGDRIVNFVRADGVLVCGTILCLMLTHGDPESMLPETAERLAEILTESSPFPVDEDRAS